MSAGAAMHRWRAPYEWATGSATHPLAHQRSSRAGGRCATGLVVGLLPRSVRDRAEDLLLGGASGHAALRAAHPVGARARARAACALGQLRSVVQRSAVPGLIAVFAARGRGFDAVLSAAGLSDGAGHRARRPRVS